MNRNKIIIENKKLLLIRNKIIKEAYLNQKTADINFIIEQSEISSMGPMSRGVENVLTTAAGAFFGAGDIAVFVKALTFDLYRYKKALDVLSKVFQELKVDVISGYEFSTTVLEPEHQFFSMTSELSENEQDRLESIIYDINKAFKTLAVSVVSAVPDPTFTSSAVAMTLSTLPVEKLIVQGLSIIPEKVFDIISKLFKIITFNRFVPAGGALLINSASLLKAIKENDYLKNSVMNTGADIANSPDFLSENIKRQKEKILIKELYDLNTAARRKYSKKLTTLFLLESINHEEEVYNEMIETQNTIVIDLIDLFQRLVESLSIPGSSGLSVLVGAVSQATYGKEFILGVAHLYYRQAGNKPIARRITQFTPAAITAMLGGPVGILLSPLVGLLGNLIGDALLVLGHSVDLMGGIQESSMSGLDQAKDILGDIVAGGLNSFSPISFASIASVAKNGFEIYHGIKKLKDLNTRADTIAKSGSRDETHSSGDSDNITVDMGDINDTSPDYNSEIIDITPQDDRLPGPLGGRKGLSQRQYFPRPGAGDV